MRIWLTLLAGCVAAVPVFAQAPGGFMLRQGDTTLSVQCGQGETMQACADAAVALGAGRGGAAPAGGQASESPDVAPTIWLQRTPQVDPTRLPLGNGRLVTDAPRKGFVFACDPFMYSMSQVIGATRTGAWVDVAGGTYDLTRKVFDRGRVEWQGRFSAVPQGDQLVITGNGLPIAGVPTGVFPVPVRDPAYQYDRNPNAISEQPIRFAVPLHPAFGPGPRCTYKEVGITLDGVQLHTGLDSSGRDENGYELNDTCNGKPQPGGGYHRHALSACTPHIGERAVVVGYALDGFPITGPLDAAGNEQTTADLDECHGTTSEVTWDERQVNTYHYVLTRDFPYSVACFRGTPTRNAFPPLPGAPPQMR